MLFSKPSLRCHSVILHTRSQYLQVHILALMTGMLMFALVLGIPALFYQQAIARSIASDSVLHQNGLDAQQLNDKFSLLNETDSCTGKSLSSRLVLASAQCNHRGSGHNGLHQVTNGSLRRRLVDASSLSRRYHLRRESLDRRSGNNSRV